MTNYIELRQTFGGCTYVLPTTVHLRTPATANHLQLQKNLSQMYLPFLLIKVEVINRALNKLLLCDVHVTEAMNSMVFLMHWQEYPTGYEEFLFIPSTSVHTVFKCC